MAKSLFEPKRVPKYTENVIKPGVGLQAVPTPPQQRTVTTGTPKLAQATPPPPTPAPVTPPAPAPAPKPVVIPETRAFSFDGSTELTGSFSTEGGNQTWAFMLHGTFTPGWAQADTGSYVVMSIGTPDSDTYRQTVYFERESGSFGYRDSIVTEATSGSAYNRYKIELNASPNFYSGSTEADDLYIQFNSVFARSGFLIEDGAGTPRTAKKTKEVSTSSQSRQAKLVNRAWTENNVVSIGGYHSGSDNRYQGEIANLALFKIGARSYGQSLSKTMPDFSKDASVAWYWRFEGDTTATKGSNLDVIGTETYVSSSI